MGTPEGHQKSIFNTSKVEKTKTHMGSIRQNLQAQPKNTKKVIETPNQPIEIKKISNKSEKKAKIRMGATRRSLQAQPKILKKLSQHQIYQSGQTFFQKK
jgi:septum formation inhibitor MinC